MYQYTVSKLHELNENGFTYDFNLHEAEIRKTQINMRSNIFIAMNMTQIQVTMSFMVQNPLQVKKGRLSQVFSKFSL
jgi:hypothetical protein